MRTRTVTICVLVTLCLARALAVREGVSGAGAEPTDGGRADTPGDGVRPPRDAWSAVVRRVIDGDTVILLVRGRPVRVRLIGADAPEIWHRRDCLGAEAARALRGLLPPGSPVRAADDREAVDRYGRRLLYLWTLGRGADAVTTRTGAGGTRMRAGTTRADAGTRRAGARTTRAGADATGAGVARTPTFVAAALVRAGLARAMYVSPNTRYASVLRTAETFARRSRAGLWAACAGR